MQDNKKYNQDINFFKLLKRLELIKSLILLEEIADIDKQVLILKTDQAHLKINIIISKLENKEYSSALELIDQLIKNNKQIDIYQDPEILVLKQEAKALENQIQSLSIEKSEIEKLIHDFNLKYNIELGDIILQILKLKRDRASTKIEREDSERDYDNFQRSYEGIKKEEAQYLNESDQKLLKELYRKASKLCHPDVVSDEFKEFAHKIFMELKIAYEKNNLQRVREILLQLERGNYFTSNSENANQKSQLISEVSRLKLILQGLIREIKHIKDSDTYKTIIMISNWDEYFAVKKDQLEEKLTRLENE